MANPSYTYDLLFRQFSGVMSRSFPTGPGNLSTVDIAIDSTKIGRRLGLVVKYGTGTRKEQNSLCGRNFENDKEPVNRTPDCT